MKYLIFFATIALVQQCLCAPTSNELTNEDIADIRKELNTIPEVDKEAVEKFISILNNFRANSTDEDIVRGTIELLSLAVNAEVSKINQTVYDDSSSSSEDSEESKESLEGLTEEELKEIEAAFAKELSPCQTKHAMGIFRGFRQGASSKSTENALMDLFTSAIIGALGIKDDPATKESSTVQLIESNTV